MGEAFGMVITHAMAAGMGGMRTAGDLVARMQIARSMKIDEAKKYVADKLGCSVADLSDEVAMYDIREIHNIGRVTTAPGLAKGIEAKVRIGNLLGLNINSVNTFKRNAGVEFN